MKVKEFFLSPSNLNLKQTLKDNGLDVSAIIQDKYNYLVHSVFVRSSLHPDGNEKESPFVPVHSQCLADAIGPKYSTEVKNNLAKCGVLECDGKYIRGVKSLGYRLAPEHWNTSPKLVRIQKTDFAAKLAEIRRQFRKRLLESSPVFQYLFDYLLTIDLDAERAREFVKGQKYPEVKKPEVAREWRLYAIKAFEQGEYCVFEDEQGRFYSNFIQLSRDVRQFCSFGGKDIWQADFTSLQPALLASLYAPLEPEREKYISVIKNGIYQFLANRYSRKFDLSNAPQKREFKEAVFSHYLFCENYVQSEMRAIWEKEFPVLAGHIRVTKNKNHGDLPKGLQVSESGLILGKVIPELMKENIPLQSIHDCIATTEEHIERVAKEMDKQFSAAMGFSLGVKIEKVTV